MICPKCGFEQIDGRSDCIKCGIIFDKFASKTDRARRVVKMSSVDNQSGMNFFKELFFDVKPDINPFYFGGRVLLFLIILSYGIKFMLLPMETAAAIKSFLHMINLPFHEAGHILFRPFGKFMTSLGGSLMQLLVPIICVVVFLIKSRDTFAASVSLWWLGESLLDLAPYINDAQLQRAILLGGVTGKNIPGYHDWHFILYELGMLKKSHTLAETAHASGIILMIIAFIWGAYVLFRQFRNIQL